MKLTYEPPTFAEGFVDIISIVDNEVHDVQYADFVV
jgi:hypothetical protein